MLFQGIEKREFYQRFSSKEDCLAYLANFKWSQGYKCRKCECTDYMKGKQAYSRRCKQCKYDESPTSHTLFHRLKFSILTAFEIIFCLSTKKKGESTLALSEELPVSYVSCLRFRRKVQKAMESSHQFPLKGKVEVDETAIGGYDAESPGRAKGDKKLSCIALEITKNGSFGRAYGQLIKDYSTKELTIIFEKHIDKSALVRTDKWKGYLPLKETYHHLKQEKSEGGANFEQLHIHIMNLKSWIRGTHHHLSENYFQYYLDEFHFRFNRRNFRNSIFNKLIKKMIESPPCYNCQLVSNVT